MNDHDLRTAFRHLEEDVINNVKTEHRLEQITTRRAWVRPIFVSLASAAAVIVIVGAAILALRPAGTDTTVPPATNTSAVPTTAVPDSTTPSTTQPATTEAGVLDLSNDSWVMQTTSGIVTSTSGRIIFKTAPLLGMPNLARDHLGGVAFIDESGLWWWRAGISEPQLVVAIPAVSAGSMIEVIPTEGGPVARITIWSPEQTEIFVSLDSGTEVDPVTGSVAITDDGTETIIASNGLSATVTQPEVTRDGDGYVDSVIEPAHLIIEREGARVLDVRIGSENEAWARIHDFDGEHVIVSVGPYEPAVPLETYYVIDLACADCTTSFTEGGATAALTGPDVDWNGEIAGFGGAIQAAVDTDVRIPAGTAIVADPTLAPDEPIPGEISLVEIADTTVAVGVDRAVSDRTGGLFVQTGNTIGWARPNAPSINLFSGEDLVESGSVEITLEDVANVDGQINVVFTVRGGEGEQSYGEVWRYDVGTGAPTQMVHFGLADGAMTRASLQNGVLALTFQVEGYSWIEFYDVNGDPIETNNPKPNTGDSSSYVDQGVLTSEGEVLVYLESRQLTPSETGEWPMDIVVWDLTTGSEMQRLALDLGTAVPDRLDYDGSDVVLGLRQIVGDEWQRETPIRVTLATGGISQIGVAGIPSLAR